MPVTSNPAPLYPAIGWVGNLLAKNRNMTLSQGFIQRVIWSDDVEAGDTLKKYIQRLRRKLGDDARNPIWIKTVHGVGYRFNSPAPDGPPAEIAAGSHAS